MPDRGILPPAIPAGGSPVGGASNLDTAGYIPYVSAAGVLSIDKTANRVLFWDATNHRLGVGTTAPGSMIHLKSAQANSPILTLESTDNTGGVQSGILRFAGSTGKQYQWFVGASSEMILRDSNRGVNVITVSTLGALTIISPTVTIGTDFMITAPTIPASAAAAGSVGQISWASGFLYVCISSGVWQRVAIATW